MKNNFKRILSAAAVLFCVLLAASVGVFADSPTDEILNYVIIAEPNADATVNLSYHIEWMVLESDGVGPVSWVTVGIPNRHYIEYEAESGNISSMAYSSENGSSLTINFDREYYEGEIISFDFRLVQDYMYQMNDPQDGISTFTFTPGWFDEIDVDIITVRWKNEGLDSWSPDCFIKDGYNEWNSSLSAGETFTVRLSYPNDAFSFDESKGNIPQEDYSSYNEYYDSSDYAAAPVGMLVVFASIGLFIHNITKKYKSSANFATTKPKITRTKVTYYPVCQGCGAPRAEGETNCSHCGRSFVKSEEIIKEESVSPEDKEALSFKQKGEYRYSSSPDTYVRVNVINVPVPRSHSSSTRSSCASSSCACVSCACACACACAGGGRAGCTAKDFYNTDLKLRQLELIAKGKKNK